MRSIFTFTMILFLLAACGIATQPVAPTATVTPPPTITLIPSATPTASMAPAPTEAPLPEGVKELQEKLKETDYSVGWSTENKDQLILYFTGEEGAKVELPEIIINPDGTGATHKYTFTAEGYDPVVMEVPVTVDELVTGDLEGWKIKDGVVEKQPVLSNEGSEREYESVSRLEVIQLLLQDATAYPPSEMASESTEARLLTNDRAIKLLNNAPPIYYKGMQYGITDIVNSVNGIFLYRGGIKVEGGVHTMVYAYQVLLSGQTFIAWVKPNGTEVEFMIDYKLPSTKALVINE